MIDKHTALTRIVGVEEHVNLPSLTSRLPETAMIERGFLSRDEPFGRYSMLEKMNDTEGRLKDLDAVGLTVQVLSYPLPGAALLPPQSAALWAREANDEISRRVAAHPDRYAGFAHLPLTDPHASAEELERAVERLGYRGALVNGATDGRYLDHPSFEPLLTKAEVLDVPVYLHPAPSPKQARDMLYGGLPDDFGFWLSVSGWGCHADTAVHLLRLMLSGAFQRHPKLKIIIGHLGEGLQIMLPRLDQQLHRFAGFDGVPSEILRKHVWVSTGGFFFMPSFMATLDAFGADRMLYSVTTHLARYKAGATFWSSCLSTTKRSSKSPTVTLIVY